MTSTGDIAEYPQNFIRFLGTAGTRYVMLSQRRSTGGIWFSYGGLTGVIDPGPGSLVQICNARPKLSPLDIQALILTHRHIDHSSDLNVLVEGMTLKAKEPRGRVLLPKDALEPGDAVLLHYAARQVKHIDLHKNRRVAQISANVTVESVKHAHRGVKCYGLVFRADGLPSWGIISDTAALPSFPEHYAACALLVVNVTLPMPWVDHMSIPDVASLLQVMHPKRLLMSHMGSHILDMGPEEVARKLCTGETAVTAARDGMVVDLDNFSITDIGGN